MAAAARSWHSSTAAAADAEDLHEVGMGEDVCEAAPGEVAQSFEVAPPDVLDGHGIPEARLHVDGLSVDQVDGPEQVVPRVGREDLGELAVAAGEPLELEPELDRSPRSLAATIAPQ